MADKSNFIFNNDNLEEFKSVMNDLTKISPTVKMKMDENNLLLYTTDTSGENSAVGHASVLAMKFFTFTYDHFMKIKHYDDEETKGRIDWIIKNGKIFNKKLSFLNKDAGIKGVFNLRKMPNNDEVKYARNVILTDNKFKFSLTGDEPHVMRDVSIEQLNTVMDPNISELSFKVPTKEFENAKSFSQIEPDDIITIHIKNGKIYFKQDSWELLIGDIDYDGTKKICFNKKYLKSINPKVDKVHFSVFQTFILYQEDNQKFVISYEQF